MSSSQDDIDYPPVWELTYQCYHCNKILTTPTVSKMGKQWALGGWRTCHVCWKIVCGNCTTYIEGWGSCTCIPCSNKP